MQHHVWKCSGDCRIYQARLWFGPHGVSESSVTDICAVSDTGGPLGAATFGTKGQTPKCWGPSRVCGCSVSQGCLPTTVRKTNQTLKSTNY